MNYVEKEIFTSNNEKAASLYLYESSKTQDLDYFQFFIPEQIGTLNINASTDMDELLKSIRLTSNRLEKRYHNPHINLNMPGVTLKIFKNVKNLAIDKLMDYIFNFLKKTYRQTGVRLIYLNPAWLEKASEFNKEGPLQYGFEKLDVTFKIPKNLPNDFHYTIKNRAIEEKYWLSCDFKWKSNAVFFEHDSETKAPAYMLVPQLIQTLTGLPSKYADTVSEKLNWFYKRNYCKIYSAEHFEFLLPAEVFSLNTHGCLENALAEQLKMNSC